VSTDTRPNHADGDLLGQLQRQLAVDLPAHVSGDMDRRVNAAISIALAQPVNARLLGQRRPSRRVVAGLAVAVFIAAAAAPVIKFFDGWGKEFDRVFALSTQIDQSAIHEGYRLTVVRAYADASSLRLAIVAEDLQDRGWAEIVVGNPTVTDDDGRAFAMWSGQYNAPTRTSSEGWLRFNVPSGAADPAMHHLTVAIDRLNVRPAPAPTLPNGEVDPDNVWTSVPGSWSFEFDVTFLAEHTATPNVSTTVGAVTGTWDELSVTPAATVGRLRFAGLRTVESGWDPYFRVERDGRTINLEMLAPGSVQNSLLFEGVPGFDDLSGTWTITIDEFHRDIPDPDSDVTTEEESIVGPWVLTFEGPTADAP
jgi:hypothetical protein